MLGPIEGTLECRSLETFEQDSEGVKEWRLLGIHDNIRESHKLWFTEAYHESFSYLISVDSFNWKSECILLGISDDETLGLSDNKMLGVAKYFKLIEELGC